MADNNSLGIIIKALLSKDVSDIENQIQQLSTQIKQRLELKLKIDASDLKVVTKGIDDVQQKIKKQTIVNGSQFINLDVERQAFSEITSRISEVRKNVDELAKVNIKTDKNNNLKSAELVYYNKELGQTVKETMGWSVAQKKVNGELASIRTFQTQGFSYSDDIAKANKEAEKLVDNLSKVNNTLYKQKSSLETRNFNYGQVLNGVDASVFDSRENFLTSIKSQYGETAEIIGKFNAEQLKTGEIIKRVTYHAQDGQGNWRKYTDTLNTTTGEMYRLDAGMSKVINRELTLSKAIRTAAEKFPIWIGVSTAYMAILHSISSGISTLKELDSLMVDIAKVTNLSAEAMDNLKKSSFEAASTFGRKAQDYLKSVAEFSRAGYDSQSESLAKLSLLAQNVGELTESQANEFLLATDAAYKYKGSQEQLLKVLDGANQIDNKFATSIQKVSEGMTVAGSVSSNASVGVNELASAVGTMTAVTQRSGNEAGRAFRSILMNIRQIKGETEDGEIIDDEKISKSAKALDDVGIKVHEVVNGVEQLRNPMSVLKDLSSIWSSLSSVKQAPVIEAIGGKYRANQLVALLENWSMYEKMLTEYSNATGSAMKENEKRMSSWESKMNQLSNSLNNFWNNTLNTNLIKGFIGSLNGLVNVLDFLINNSVSKFAITIGLVTVSIWGASTALTALKASTLGTAIGVIALDIAEKGLLATSKALWATLSASPLFWAAAATAAIVGIVKIFDALNVSIEEQREKVEQAKQAYEETTSEIKSLNEELATTTKRIDELNSKDKLSITEKDELNNLQLTNKELELRLAMLEKEEEIKSKRLGEEQLELYNKQYGKYDYSKNQVQEYINNAQMTGNNAILVSEMNDIAALSAAYQQFSDLKQEALESGDLQNVEHFDSLLTDIQENLINSSKELQTAKDTLSSLKNPTEEQKQALVGIEARLNAINKIVIPDQFKDIVDNVPPASDAIQTFTINYEELNKAIDDAQSNLGDLNQALADNGKLTSTQVLDIIQKYPELIDKIETTTNGYKIQESALEDLRKQQIKTALDSITSQINEADNVKIQTENKLKQYGLEIEKLKDIAKAKAELARLAHEEAVNFANASAGAESNEMLREKRYASAYQRSLKESGYAELSVYEEVVKGLEDLSNKKKTYENLLNDKKLGTKSGTDDKKEYTPSTEQQALKDLLDAGKINLQTYYDRLLQLEDQLFKGYKNKSIKQLESELRSKNEDTAKKAKEYLTYTGEKSNVQDQLFKNTLDTLSSDYDKGSISLAKYISSLEALRKQSGLTTEQLAEINKVILDLNDNQEEIIRKANDAKLELYEDTESKIIDLLKQKYEQEADLEEKAHNDRQDALDKSLESYKRYVEDTLSEQDRLNATEDYNDKVAESNTKLQDINKQINELSAAAMSGDLDAINRIAELQKEKDEESKNLKEIQKDRERDLVKDSLQDNLKNYERYIDDQKDLENEAYDDFKEQLQKKTSESALALEAQNILAQQNITTVQNSIIDLFTITGQNATTAGQIIQDQIIAKLAQLQDIQTNLRDITDGSSRGESPTGGGSGQSNKKDHTTLGGGFEKMTYDDFAKYLANKYESEYGNASQERLAELRTLNELLRKKYGISNDKYSYRQLKDYFDYGGLAYGTGYMPKNTILPERVLSPTMTVQFEKLVNMMPKLADAFKFNIPNLNIPKLAVGNGSVNIGDIKIFAQSVDNNSVPKLAREVASVIKNEFYRSGR